MRSVALFEANHRNLILDKRGCSLTWKKHIATVFDKILWGKAIHGLGNNILSKKSGDLLRFFIRVSAFSKVLAWGFCT